MDGKELLVAVRQQLLESESSSFMNDKLTYQFLWDAATEIVELTSCLTSSQEITTIADQSQYTLNADFIRLYLKNSYNQYYLKYNDGSNNYFITIKDYQDIILYDDTVSVSIPDNFTIVSNNVLSSRLSGTCTTAGSISGGEAVLIDSSADFTNVSAGDIIHNTTDSSSGIVLSKTSSTQITTALFDGTDNDWDVGDGYVIQPQSRLNIILNPPPQIAGHTVTIYYVKKPAPVFSDYGIYNFQSRFFDALVDYACWRYKYRDKERSLGDSYYAHWINKVKGINYQVGNSLIKRGFRVNLKPKG